MRKYLLAAIMMASLTLSAQLSDTSIAVQQAQPEIFQTIQALAFSEAMDSTVFARVVNEQSQAFLDVLEDESWSQSDFEWAVLKSSLPFQADLNYETLRKIARYEDISLLKDLQVDWVIMRENLSLR